MTTATPWAILLCKFKDNDVEPYERQRYLELFGRAGTGKLGMVDFFTDMSHGKIDISSTEVFGWLTLEQNRSEYLGLASRDDIVNWAQQAAVAAGIKLAPFYSATGHHRIVVVMNVQTDLFGSPAGVVCDDGRSKDNGMSGLSPSYLGQEMLHGYGLGHARTDGSVVDYTDRADVMSTANAEMAPHPVFNDLDVRANPVFLMGPGLNAASMDALGWLDHSRVWSNSAENIHQPVRLRPLHRRDLPGFLAARLGQYYIEFRDKDRWDQGMPEPVVFVHRFDDTHSYVMPGNLGVPGLRAGDSFGDPPRNPTQLNLTSVLRVEVLNIDPQGRFADIQLIREPGLEIPMIGAQVLLGGITRGAGGIVILPGGGIRKIPPNSPLTAVLQHIAVFESGAEVPSLGLQQQVRRQALQQIVGIATQQLESMAEIREPTLSGRQE